MLKTKQPDQYTNLISIIGELLDTARKTAYQQVNTILVKTYREIGRHIVEYEQGGKEKAEYGSGLLQDIANDLTKQYGKGFSVDNIENMRRFYLAYPNSETLSRKLSRSHYLRLMRIKDDQERKFYEIECEDNRRSLKELNRQFDSALYQRLALSRDKEKVFALSKQGQIIEKPQDMMKDPLILEFLGLKEEDSYSESVLEQAIISNLSHFLLELGKGFAFVGRQQRISDGPNHRYVDLVFYNRLLRCFMLIDLKIGTLTHQDIGQMQMYINWYDREVKKEGENSTVGLILCRDKSHFVIKYTLPTDNKQIFANEYQLYLPSKEELEKELEKIREKTKE